MKINFNVSYKEKKGGRVRYILSQKRPLSFAAHRLRWWLYPYLGRLGYTARRPEHLDIETVSTCQLKCAMCFQVGGHDLKHGLMKPEVFKKLVDEAKRIGVYSIRLSWRGECLLHPKFGELLEYAVNSGIPDVSFLTNAERMTEELMHQLVALRVNYIVISVDGIGDTYNKVRWPSTFDDIIAKLTRLKEIKAAAGTRLPLVRINTVSFWIRDPREREEFYRVLDPLCDRFLVSQTVSDFAGYPTPRVPDRICQSPFQRLSITWDGKAFPCCADFTGLYEMGDTAQFSIAEAWRSPAAAHMRDMQAKRRRLETSVCAQRDCGIDEVDRDNDPEFARRLLLNLPTQTARRTVSVPLAVGGLKK